MNREIKFRGRRLDNGQWITGSLTFIQDADGVWLEDKDLDVVKVDPDTLGQYTGLKDRDSREIYEWDIVKSPRYNVPAVVCFIKGVFAVCNPNCCDTCAKFEGAIESLEEAIVFSNGELEVVGNLHDNPQTVKE